MELLDKDKILFDINLLETNYNKLKDKILKELEFLEISKNKIEIMEKELKSIENKYIILIEKLSENG